MEPKTYGDGLPHAIWQHALCTRGHGKFNLSALSRMVGASPTKLWWYVHGKTRWPADAWLRCMLAAGFASIKDQVLLIDLALPDDMCDEMAAVIPRDETHVFRRKVRDLNRGATVSGEVEADYEGDEALTYTAPEENMAGSQEEEFSAGTPDT